MYYFDLPNCTDGLFNGTISLYEEEASAHLRTSLHKAHAIRYQVG